MVAASERDRFLNPFFYVLLGLQKEAGTLWLVMCDNSWLYYWLFTDYSVHVERMHENGKQGWAHRLPLVMFFDFCELIYDGFPF